VRQWFIRRRKIAKKPAKRAKLSPLSGEESESESEEEEEEEEQGLDLESDGESDDDLESDGVLEIGDTVSSRGRKRKATSRPNM
jgi:hypothetical protein